MSASQSRRSVGALGSRVSGVLLFAVAAAFLGGLRVQAADTGLAWLPAGPATLMLETTDDTASGTLDLVLSNPSSYSGPVQLGTSTDGVSVTPESIEVSPAGAQPVGLTITMARSLSASIKLLAVTATAEQGSESIPLPAILEVRIGKAPKALADAVLEPAELTFTADRFVPSVFEWDCDCWWWPASPRIRLHNVTKLPRDYVPWTLASDSGSRLGIILRDPTDGDDSMPAGVSVHLGGATSAGAYKGAVPFDPSDPESKTLMVTVHVQDFVLWPLLAVAVGSAAAYLFAVRRDQQRPKDVLLARIAGLAGPFPIATTCPYRLTKLPTRQPSWRCPPAAGASRLEDLYCAVETARNLEALDEVATEVADISDGVGHLERACKLQKALVTAIEEHQPPGDVPPPMFAHAQKLIDTAPTVATAADAKKLADSLADQAVAIGEWAEAKASIDAAEEVYGRVAGKKVSDADEAVVHEHHPAGIRVAFLMPAKTLEDMTSEEVVRRAKETLATLTAIESAYPTPPAQGQPAFRPSAVQSVGAAMRDTVEAIGASVPTSPSILATVRRGDWIEFAVTYLATVALYLGVIYVGKDFGSLWGYLTAFLAGLGGALVIDWQILPWYRTLRPAKPKES